MEALLLSLYTSAGLNEAHLCWTASFVLVSTVFPVANTLEKGSSYLSDVRDRHVEHLDVFHCIKESEVCLAQQLRLQHVKPRTDYEKVEKGLGISSARSEEGLDGKWLS